MNEITFYLLVFGIALLVVLLTRKAFRKVKSEQAAREGGVKPPPPPQKPKLTEEEFNKSWKGLSYLLLLAAAGNLYMVYTAVRAALAQGIFVYWVDAGFSLLAAAAAYYIWRRKNKRWVYIYFVFLIIPIFMFMSLQGPGFKESALIHLFPMVLLYFVLKPVWTYLPE